jgi:hypothetical protein
MERRAYRQLQQTVASAIARWCNYSKSTANTLVLVVSARTRALRIGPISNASQPFSRSASLFSLFLQEIVSGGLLLCRRNPRPWAALQPKEQRHEQLLPVDQNLIILNLIKSHIAYFVKPVNQRDVIPSPSAQAWEPRRCTSARSNPAIFVRRRLCRGCDPSGSADRRNLAHPFTNPSFWRRDVVRGHPPHHSMTSSAQAADTGWRTAAVMIAAAVIMLGILLNPKWLLLTDGLSAASVSSDRTSPAFIALAHDQGS